jgi:anhydro-N-acetylmuramic acid kinase
MENLRAIGLMSGTSCDGVDIALIESDGETRIACGPHGMRSYRPDERKLLKQALEEARILRNRKERTPCLREAEDMVTKAHKEAVQDFLTTHAIEPKTLDVIGFHGQTVLHRPDLRLTIQIGDGAALARETHIPVVWDFRAADVAAGGQGAPLVPVWHRALVRNAALKEPVVVINIGGVANLTWISGERMLAFDTGPGNALMDDLVQDRLALSYDAEGSIAARGKVDHGLVEYWMKNAFFGAAPPKSLDRNSFSTDLVAEKSVEDALATLSEFTVQGVLHGVDHCPEQPQTAIFCGGGVYNKALIATLTEWLAKRGVKAQRAHEIGWSQDALEAQAFAFLAIRHKRNLPLTFTGTTGTAVPLTGGIYAEP